MGFFDDVVKGVTQVATVLATPLVAPFVAVDALTGNHAGLLKEFGSLVKEGKTSQDLQRTADDQAASAEANARSGAFNDALTANDLDATTLQELTNLYNSGADSGAIAQKINEARAGKGIYAVRQLNAAEQSTLGGSPGRAQLSSLGSTAILGGQSTNSSLKLNDSQINQLRASTQKPAAQNVPLTGLLGGGLFS